MNLTTTPDDGALSGIEGAAADGSATADTATSGSAEVGHADRRSGTGRTAASTSDRAALGTFVVAWLAAFPILLHAGRDQWFALDEWSFLATRELTDPSTLFATHNEHWSTVPIVLYRLVFAVVGLNHYWPYLLMAIGAHLAAAALLRLIMRRAGVGPWLASAGAILFAYFGAGRENFGWAFQVGFAGALALGLVHFVLADQDSPKINRRDLVAWLFGLLTLMSAGVGVFMVAGVGLATLLRRGWRVACFHAVPLGAIYLVWYASESPGASGAKGRVTHVGGLAFDFLADTVRGIAGGGLPAAVLVALVVAGAVLGAVDDPSRLRREWAVPASMFATAMAFSAATAFGRRALAASWDVDTADRYVHILAALVLPAIVVSVGVVAARHRVLLAIAAVVFAVGFVSNASSLEPTGSARFLLGDEQIWVARADAVEKWPVPGDVVLPPDAFGPPWGVRVDWLRNLRADGGIPRLDDIPAEVRERAALSVLVVQVEPATSGCEEVGPGPVELRRGQIAQVPVGQVQMTWLDDGQPRAAMDVRSYFGPVAVQATTETITIAMVAPDGSPTTISRCT